MVSTAGIRVGAALVLWAGLAAGVRGSGGSLPERRDVADLCARGLELGYNLDYADALHLFEEAITLDPEDPRPHRLAAAALWTQTLFRQGAITAEDFLGETKANASHTPPPSATEAAFHGHVARALTLAEARVARSPLDAAAHFQLGAAVSFQATWTATVEGRVFRAVRAARRAYHEHERALELDPARTDAALIVGLYRYTVSTLSAPKRLIAHLAGIGGGRDRGLQLVERAAAVPSDVQANARFTLIVIYTRESRFDDALTTIRTLQVRYPRNRLLWLEEGNTLLRAGRRADALRAIDAGLARFAADPRPRATGEEARWQEARRAALSGGR